MNSQKIDQKLLNLKKSYENISNSTDLNKIINNIKKGLKI
jgi:hypothetical protein